MKFRKALAMTLAAMMACSFPVIAQAEEGSSDALTVAIWDTNQEPGLTEILKDFTEKTGIQANIQVTP